MVGYDSIFGLPILRTKDAACIDEDADLKYIKSKIRRNKYNSSQVNNIRYIQDTF